MNVIAPASDEAPRKCRLKIAKETAEDVEKSAPDRGKYKDRLATLHYENLNRNCYKRKANNDNKL